MSRIDEFKQFITTVPKVKEDVLNGRYTWQQLYEIYTMYGEDDKFWQSYKQTSTMDFAALFEMLKNVDLDSLSKSLSSVEKVLSMTSGLFTKDEEEAPRQKNKWYDE